MISGEKGKDLPQRALKRGAAAFLAKPFRPADIDSVLHGLFGLRLPELMTWTAEQPAATGRAASHAARATGASGGRQASARAQ
jgi:ActR/RegA family two-component response regulator